MSFAPLQAVPARLTLGLLSLAVIIAACAEGTAPTPGPQGPAFNEVPTPPQRTLVCKDGPPGDFTASRTADGIVTDGWAGTLLVSNPFTVASGTCVEVFEGGATIDNLVIREINIPSNVTLEKITVQLLGGDCAVSSFHCPVTYTGVDHVTVQTFSGGAYRITFFNVPDEPPPPPPGGEGCTPGFWRNHLSDWAAAGYSPSADFDATFGVDAFSPNITLGTAINLGGGGLNKLARHGTAALLNAGHPDVSSGFTTAQIIAAVQNAIATGQYEPLASQLSTLNEQGCQID